MRVLVFGAVGQLGRDVVEEFTKLGDTCLPATRELADLTQPGAVDALVASERPDAVVNCAAYHDVAGCERSPKLAFAVNAAAVEEMARASDRIGAKLLTVSTDYVFDGRKHGGYIEEDPPGPLNHYGESKLDGERRATAAHGQTFVVRTQSLFGLGGPSGKGLNFVDLMLKLSQERDELKVDQFRMAPTSTATLARNMHTLLHTEEFGLYHMSCEGETTWHEFAVEILRSVGAETKVTPVSNSFYETPFVRPERTYLINSRLRARDLDRMPRWQDALAEYLRAKGPA